MVVQQTTENHRSLAAVLNHLRTPGALPLPPHEVVDEPVPLPVLSSTLDRPLLRSFDGLGLRGLTLRAAIERLHDLSGTDVFVDWDDFRGPKVGPDTTIDLEGRPLSLGQALAMIAACTGRDVAFVPEGNGVRVSTTRGILSRATVCQVYDVQDLLARQKHADDPDRAARELVDAVTRGVALNSWQEDSSDQDPTACVFAGKLVVTATRAYQAKIADFVRKLRD